MEYSKELHEQTRELFGSGTLWAEKTETLHKIIMSVPAFLDEIDRLNKLHEWIPVTPDTMPEYGYRVLVVSEGEVEIGWVNNINKVKTFNLPNVTKWQPLPPQEQP